MLLASSLPLAACHACDRNPWLQRFRPAAALTALLCLGVVCTPATAQVTQLPVWVKQNPTASPAARVYAMMAYDAAAGNVVLFGGANDSGVNSSFNILNDTWLWNGTTWTEQFPTTSPSARSSATMSYDAATGNMVLFGGANYYSVAFNDTWVWNGITWTEESPAASPPARSEAAMAYDAAAGNMVLFGGLSSNGYMCDNCLSDTWVWNESTWTEEENLAASPSARLGATMVYDPASGNVVLFGGYSNSGVLNDTWIWNGSTWTEESLTNSPPARYLAAMAYDAVGGNVVLFGGEDSSGNVLNDTWVWNGNAWNEESLINAPPARFAPTLAYDAVAGNIVLFGGDGNRLNVLNDTWTLAANAVNLGTAYVCPSGATTPSPCNQSATIQFSVDAGTTVSSINALTQGTQNLDFTVNSSTTTCTTQVYSATTTCTVGVTFAPKYAGARNGAVVIKNGSDVLASVYVFGIGTAPQVAFNPGTASVLGGGFSQPSGTAVDGGGNVYVADWGNNEVKKIPLGCAASSCVIMVGGGFGTPSRVAVDGGGNVYVADSSNNAVKEMPPGCASASCVTTLGGGFSGPTGVAVDGSGDVYVADWGNSAVKEMLPDCTASNYNSGNCTVTTLGGGFGAPEGVAVDGVGNVYVADTGNGAVKQMPPGCTAFDYSNGTCTITTLGGGFSQPFGVAVDGGGDVYVADSGNGAVKKMTPGCTASSYSSGACAITTLGSGFSHPEGVAVDGGGDVYVADSGTNAVDEINRTTPPSLSFAETNAGTESSDSPQTVTLDNIGNAALTFPVPASGNNPSISTGFQLDSSTTCPQVSASSSAGTLAASASCTLEVDFVPPDAETYNGALVLTDNNLNAAAPGYATQTINVNGTGRGAQITLSPASLPDAIYETAYSVAITASGGTAPYTYSVSAGSLSAGLTLSTSGTISGTATMTGSFSFTIKATDSNNLNGTQNYTLIVSPATPTISISDIPSSAIYGGGFTATYSYSSNGTPTESVSSSTPGVCVASGSTVSFVGVGTCTLTASATATTDDTAVTGSAQSFTVSGAALTITANNATKIYGTTNPPFTGTVTGAENGNTFTESFTTSATVSSPVGSYAIVPSVTGADLADYTQSVTDGTLTITHAASTTSVQVSNTSITPGQSVTLTATVVDASAGSSGTPTGTVNFYDNGTLLNAAPLSAGVASYSATSLTPGSSNAITATYSGDGNFTASSSTASGANIIEVAPLGFTFAITGSSTSTVNPGQSTTYQAAIAPLYGSYPGTVSFTATGLPGNATATFSPSSIAANGGAQNVTVTITTTAFAALLNRTPPSTPGRGFTPLALGSPLVLLGLGSLRRRGRTLRRPLCVLVFLGAGLAVAGLSGCGAYFKLTPQSYTVKVTATAGGVQQNATVTLKVQ